MADQFQPHLAAVKVPSVHSAVYKDECVYSFDTPETPTGLYVSLTTFLAFGRDHVVDYARHTGNAVYLHIRRERHEVPGSAAAAEDDAGEGPEKKITRLAIGVEGGFDPDAAKKRFTFEDHHSVCLISADSAAAEPIVSVPYPAGGVASTLPAIIVASVQAVLAAESASDRQAKEATAGTWDGEARVNSVYAENLTQLDNGVTIPPAGWKCERCDLTSNLWLNLTDGSVLCGRRFFDGSGGNEHAAQHYAEVKYPLAVKLGTITADGKGDVYSYAEDDMVLDPWLVQHLAHFGIKTAQLEKTEKSMVELELALNERIGEWSILTESASQLEPIAGPGYTGMRNLGNSCYLNSVMQVLFSVDDFAQRFYTDAAAFFGRWPADPAADFNVQMAKLGVGLCSGKYSTVAANSLDADGAGISPAMFKNLIGRGHVEFASKQQQDAQEYFLHLINLLEQNTPTKADNPAMAFRFTVEDRFECGDSGQVKYTERDEFCLPLPIPLHVAANLDDVKAYESRLADAEAKGVRLPADSLVRPRLSLDDCLAAFAQVEYVEQFHSTAINGKTTAKKQTRFGTLPKYLLLQLKKFTLRPDWTSVKLDVSVDIPDELDLAHYRGHGLQPGEQLLPEPSADVPAPELDAGTLANLAEMGFHAEACKRSVFFTKNTGAEAALQWLMDHMCDSDLNDVFVPPGTRGAAAPKFVADPQLVEQLMDMGFSQVQVRLALKETGNSLERATEYIFNNQALLESLEASSIGVEEMQQDEPVAAAAAAPGFDHKTAKYRLKAFISHMGTSSQVGHYVCHIQRNGKWVIFNDGKVAISQNPPKELGYLYLYESI